MSQYPNTLALVVSQVIPRSCRTYPLGFLIAVCQYIDMVCAYCSHETKVVNSRHQKRANTVWRRRKCLNCGAVATTIEHLELGGAISVHSKNSLQPFSRDVLFLSIHDSLKHRKTATTDATGLTDTILSHLYPHIAHAQLERNVIVTIAHEVLGRFDKAAATSYAAFHPL